MKKTKKVKKSKIANNRNKDQFTVVLEQINSKMDLLVEGHLSLGEKQDKLEGKVDGLGNKVERLEIKVSVLDEKVDQLDHKVEQLDQKVEQLDGGVDVLEKGQRLTLDYLERIEAELHGEIRTKISVKEFARLEKRVDVMERKMKAAF
jgi:predicted nuclease with TOPRIM domain